MFGIGNKKKQFDAKERVNRIEEIVWEELKLYGFQKYGRTLHRFVSEDIVFPNVRRELFQSQKNEKNIIQNMSVQCVPD